MAVLEVPQLWAGWHWGRQRDNPGHASRGYFEATVLVLVYAALILGYLCLDSALPTRPHHPTFDQGWWGWFDQGKYLLAATAWSNGNLAPTLHYYLPGYPLLGAPFVHVTPANPFLVPNLLCLLASCWIFTRIATRLCVGMPYPRAIGAATFLAANASPSVLVLWIVPWSSTGSTPLILSCLLACLWCMEQPASKMPPAVIGLCGGCIVAFRPADAAAVLVVAAAIIGWALVHPFRGWRHSLFVILMAAIPFLLCCVALVIIHLAIYGFHLSPYLVASRNYGFEWRRIPMEWVAIVLDPRPLFADQRGLSEAFPWIVPGIAGAAASASASCSGTQRRAHLLVIGVLLSYFAFYLAYRGLNPDWLWHFNLYHYFLWTYPVFALYALLLVVQPLLRPRISKRPLLVAAGTLLVLLPWRIDLSPAHDVASKTVRGTLIVPTGLPGLDEELIIPARADTADILLDDDEISIGGRLFHNTTDFQAYPRPDGFAVMPLRPLPQGEARIALGPGIALPDNPRLRRLAVHLRYGVPCWFSLAGQPCNSPESNRLTQ